MITENIGVVLSGMVLISYGDIWGNTSILGNAAPGCVFAEVYACIPEQPSADHCICRRARNRAVYECGAGLDLLLQYLPFHARLARNLLTVCADKAFSFPEE